MWKLDIKRRSEKILFLTLILVLGIALVFIFFSSILPKELGSTRGAAILGLILNFYGTFLLAMTLVRPDKEIKDMASTYYGGNAELEKDMFQNRKRALWGLILVALGFIFQFIDIFISYYVKN